MASGSENGRSSQADSQVVEPPLSQSSLPSDGGAVEMLSGDETAASPAMGTDNCLEVMTNHVDNLEKMRLLTTGWLETVPDHKYSGSIRQAMSDWVSHSTFLISHIKHVLEFYFHGVDKRLESDECTAKFVSLKSEWVQLKQDATRIIKTKQEKEEEEEENDNQASSSSSKRPRVEPK